MSGGMVADPAEVRRALGLFADPAGFCQLVALPTAVAKTLPGSDLEGLASAAAAMPGGLGVYFEVNPVRERLTSKARAVDVVRRRWLLFDIDPLKAAGFDKHSATDEEKDAALAPARIVHAYLSDVGWPEPVVVDSGNGWYLMYRIDLPNDEESRALVRAVLYAMAMYVDGETCSFDKSVHNADRLAKLPGTWARKGQQTDDRPHRPCRIVSVPSSLEVVTADQLRSVIPPDQKAQLPAKRDPFTLRAGAEVGKRPYALAALEGERTKLALTPPGDRDNQLFRSGAALGELVGPGLLTDGEIFDALTSAAQLCGLAADVGESDVADKIARAVAKGKTNPRVIPDGGVNGVHHLNGHAKTAVAPTSAGEWVVSLDGETVAAGSPLEFLPRPAGTGDHARKFELHTLRSLMKVQFEEPVWVVPGLLSEGLNILAGKPKMGKSMMALNLAMTVAAGGMALGSTQTTPGDVLYLSLEDRTRRIQARARKMLRGIGVGASDRLTVASQWPRQGEGGLEMIEWWIRRQNRPALVIIDVWGKFRPATNQKVNQYSQDYEHLAPLKDLMDRYSCCALALLHCRKGASDDVVEDVSGTLGLSGAADGIVVLQRSRNDNDAKIFITGRDVADAELALSFDPENLVWTNHGDASKRVTGQLQIKILAWLSEGDRKHTFFKTKAIAEGLGYKTPAQIRTVLDRMKNDGKVQKRTFGNDAEWCCPGTGVITTSGEDDDLL